jgi:hypothetical protein
MSNQTLHIKIFSKIISLRMLCMAWHIDISLEFHGVWNFPFPNPMIQNSLKYIFLTSSNFYNFLGIFGIFSEFILPPNQFSNLISISEFNSKWKSNFLGPIGQSTPSSHGSPASQPAHQAPPPLLSSSFLMSEHHHLPRAPPLITAPWQTDQQSTPPSPPHLLDHPASSTPSKWPSLMMAFAPP